MTSRTPRPPTHTQPHSPPTPSKTTHCTSQPVAPPHPIRAHDPPGTQLHGLECNLCLRSIHLRAHQKCSPFLNHTMLKPFTKSFVTIPSLLYRLSLKSLSSLSASLPLSDLHIRMSQETTYAYLQLLTTPPLLPSRKLILRVCRVCQRPMKVGKSNSARFIPQRFFAPPHYAVVCRLLLCKLTKVALTCHAHVPC